MSSPTTYTVRNAKAGFPENLLIVPTGLPIPRNMGDWYTAHNRAVADFQRSGMGAMNSLRRSEFAILTLATGIERWTSHTGPDGFGNQHVAAPLIRAFRAALNFDIGRLDGGTLDSWALSLLERCDLSESDI